MTIEEIDKIIISYGFVREDTLVQSIEYKVNVFKCHNKLISLNYKFGILYWWDVYPNDTYTSLYCPLSSQNKVYIKDLHPCFLHNTIRNLKEKVDHILYKKKQYLIKKKLKDLKGDFNVQDNG